MRIRVDWGDRADLRYITLYWETIPLAEFIGSVGSLEHVAALAASLAPRSPGEAISLLAALAVDGWRLLDKPQ
jgi:hypothetical protein